MQRHQEEDIGGRSGLRDCDRDLLRPGHAGTRWQRIGHEREVVVAASDGIEAEPPLSRLLRPSAPIKHDDRTVQRSIPGILDAVLIDIDDDPASNRAERHESERNALGITTA